MPKFAVRLSGTDCLIKVLRRRWLFLTKEQTVHAGMTTTRFVEADSANEATEIALKLVKLELQRDRRLTNSSSIEIEEIREDDEGFEMYAPGGGFTFSINE